MSRYTAGGPRSSIGRQHDYALSCKVYYCVSDGLQFVHVPQSLHVASLPALAYQATDAGTFGNADSKYQSWY